MPIKFSELTTKPIADVSKIVGLYVDNTSNTGASNCIISVADFAKQAKLTEVDDSAVHKSGAETITGAKTFSNSTVFNQSVTLNSTVTSNNNIINLNGTDSFQELRTLRNGVRTGGFRNITDNHNTTLMYVTSDDGSTIKGYMGIFFDGTNVKTYSPTPASGDNSTQIATTNWCVELIKKIYPVGSIYIGTNTTCPMATIIPGSTWTLVAANKALWTGSGTNANTTIEAGLPNITGTFFNSQENETSLPKDPTGAFARDASTGNGTDGSHGWFETISFNASRSSPIYGNSTTVQPPAYVVNVWRRTA